jgi:subtilase family serine protease
MPSFSLSPGEEKEVTSFLDTTGLLPGKYNLSITLAYANQVRTQTFPVIISEKAVVAEKIPLISPVLIAIIALVLILIVALLIIVFIKKRKK